MINGNTGSATPTTTATTNDNINGDLAVMTKLPTCEIGTTTSITNECAENTSDEIDVNLTSPITIPSISSRNNVSFLCDSIKCA